MVCSSMRGDLIPHHGSSLGAGFPVQKAFEQSRSGYTLSLCRDQL